MKVYFKTFPHNKQGVSGNALVYVLVLIALFAALSLVLARQTDTAESGTLSGEKINITANQILQTPMQIKQAIDQMIMTGTRPDELDFVLPTDEPAFSTGISYNKVFHPDGGGIEMPHMTNEAGYTVIGATPNTGWYLGRFNNVGWTPSAENDVILIAYQIKEEVCRRINELITGSTAVPTLNLTTAELFIDAAINGAGSNSDLTSTECAGCKDELSLCVKDSALEMWSFYSIIKPL